MTQNKLYHTDVYRGESFSDELYHWKYMSRKWKNGRWVYTYENEEYAKAKKAKSKAESNRLVRGARYAIATNNRKNYSDKAWKNGLTRREARKISEFRETEALAKDSYKKAESKYAKAEKKYKNVKIKTLPSRAVGKGAEAVANLGSILSSKVRSLGNKRKKKKKTITNGKNFVKNIDNNVKKVSNISKNKINKGRKKVANWLRRTANKID